MQPVWQDELDLNPPQQKYKFRWDAEVICDSLNIDYNTIKEIEPFKSDQQGKKANFHILVVSDSANSIKNPIYEPFRDYLLNKCETNRLANNHEVQGDWSFDVDEAIDEILSQNTENELAVDRQIVLR